MPLDVQQPRSRETSTMDRVYSPDILPRLQALLADLADIDLACEKKLDTIERSLGDESLKRKMIARLWEYHQERRAPYVAELEELQERIRAGFD